MQNVKGIYLHKIIRIVLYKRIVEIYEMSLSKILFNPLYIPLETLQLLCEIFVFKSKTKKF